MTEKSPKKLAASLEEQEVFPHKKRRGFRISLRYKLAVPVLLLASLTVFVLFRTTFKTVRELAVERYEQRLSAIAEVFAETVKVPLILKNQQVMYANIEWMAKRKDVLEVRVEDSEGTIVGGNQTTFGVIPEFITRSSYIGVERVNADTFAVAVPIQAHKRKLGRVLILFTHEGFEAELSRIFEERLMVALITALILALMTSFVTWVVIRPIYALKQTARNILAGDLSARARTDTFDEIADLGDAFNEMMVRLSQSLDNLRSRTEALEESEEKYRLVIENANDIIFSITPDDDIILLNKAISGCSRDELLHEGLPLLLSLNDEESREKFEEALELVSTAKKAVTNLAVTHQHRGNHTEVHYLVNLTPVLDSENEIKSIQGVVRDVTELRRIEMMKESLIRDVAHELKTPTAKFEMAMTWFEKEMETHKELEKYRKVIDMLKSNTDRLMTTIVSIMDLSKLESGMHELEAKPLDLNRDVLKQVATDMEALCTQKGLAFKSELAQDDLPMQGDRDMLYRVFVNLIGNSIKFTEIGEVSLKSALVNGQILVTVKDSGLGIETDNLEQVFDRFVQKTASSLGIGVGLTISRDIVAMHEGRIWAESEGLGKGATFKVEFHLKD